MSDLPGVPPSFAQQPSAGFGPGGPPLAVILATLQDLVRATNGQAQIIKANLGVPASGDLSGIYPGPMSVVSTHLAAPLPIAQGGTGNTTGTTSGAVGGDLSGTLPNPTVAKINGVPLGSTVATAGHVLVADGAQWVSQALLTGTSGGTGVNNGARTITLGGNLVTSGAFATTLTVSALTNSTLPAGAHTLAGLDVAQTWSALQQFNDGMFALKGSASGTATLKATAAAGANTQTFPAVTGTVVVATQTQASNGLFATLLKLTDFHNIDGSALAAAAAAGTFGYTIAFGTSAGLIGEAAQGNTKTDDAMAEILLPPWYIAASTVTVTANAKLIGAGVAGTHTIEIKAWRTANDGSQGANLGSGIASNITAGGADVAFALTSASLNPGDRIMIELETILQETGGAVTLSVVINSVRIS